ncbi:MAG: RNA polymerase sigma factor [Acidimicrobiales bacterium]
MAFGRDRSGTIGSSTTAFDRIVRQARGGDEDAVSVLYLNHVSMVYGYLRACGANDLDDLTSEVFVGMLRGLERFDGDQAAFRRWLMTIAHRRLIDHRRAGVRNRIDMTEPSSLEALRTTAIGIEPPTTLVDDELVAAFERLTNAQREVLALRFVADVSLRGVASITGRPTGAVKSLQNRALAMLRQHLQVGRERQHA